MHRRFSIFIRSSLERQDALIRQEEDDCIGGGVDFLTAGELGEGGQDRELWAEVEAGQRDTVVSAVDGMQWVDVAANGVARSLLRGIMNESEGSKRAGGVDALDLPRIR